MQTKERGVIKNLLRQRPYFNWLLQCLVSLSDFPTGTGILLGYIDWIWLFYSKMILIGFFCTIFFKFCSSPFHDSDSFLSRLGSLMTEIPARFPGDFGLWNFWSSTLMAEMMGAVSPSVDPYGSRIAIYEQVKIHEFINLFYVTSCLILIHIWVRDLWRLGYPDLLLGALAFRPTVPLLLLQLRLYRVFYESNSLGQTIDYI